MTEKKSTFARFRADRRGAAVLLFAAVLLPLALLIGAGVNLASAFAIRSRLQNAVDQAALAGATAYVSSSTSAAAVTAAKAYMAGAVALVPSASASVSYSATTSTASASSSTTAYIVTVTASATAKSQMLGAIMANAPISVTATAKNFVYTASIALSQFNSSALDANTLYYYIVPSDGSAPSTSNLTKLFSNTGGSTSGTIKVTLTAGQKLGLALYNVTGGRSGYGSNGYGGAQGSTHYFYSHLSPPSKSAYPTVTKNCSLQVVTSLSSLVSGSCLSSLPSYAALNCAAAAGKTLYYAWNDMGGNTDDYDYNDAVMSVTCAANDSTAQATGVLLTN
ncbi:pilus assembly protein TadG-related protein [Methylosinus sporium]|uniref:pilus assembly protein TadG-related protein n=1 Tax=Methylosinus sporium TaxID=428 RepID=UPI00383AEC21